MTPKFIPISRDDNLIDIPVSNETRQRFDDFKKLNETDNEAMIRLLNWCDKHLPLSENKT